jgi:transposase
MSMQEKLSQEIPDETALIGRQVLMESNLYRQIGERFIELFPREEEFQEMYENTGRGAISPLLLCIVTVFQMMERLPDRTAAEYVVSRIDWKYALHLPLSYSGFHFTDLSAFRQRLLVHGWERKTLDQMLEKLRTQGLIRARGKMRTDSTHVLGVVEWLSRVELVQESIRVALRAATQLAEGWVQGNVLASFRECYGERQSLYGLSDEEIVQALVQAGQDGFWFVEQVDCNAPKFVQQCAEIRLLREVLAQQFPQGPNQAPPTHRPSGKSIINSPHDAEARQGVKRNKIWFGYKVQLTESCDADLPHLITDVEPDNALNQDTQALPAIQQRLIARQLIPQEQFVDQGYLSAELLASSAEHDIRLMGKPLADTSGPLGFRQTDFQFDEDAHQATCPAGHTSQVWSEKPAPTGGMSPVKLRFAATTCQACAFFGQCTKSPQGRSLELHPFRHLLAAYRAEASTPAFRTAIRIRAGVESSFSELTRKYGLRHSRYHGLTKLRLQTVFIAIAVNISRLFRWFYRSTCAGTLDA